MTPDTSSDIESRSDNARRVSSSTLKLATVVIVGLLAFGADGLVLTTAYAQVTYNVIQVFVQPTSDRNTYFLLSAYNSSGSLVATSQSQYPVFALELPSETYLFAVMAQQAPVYVGPSPMMSAGTTQKGEPLPPTGGSTYPVPSTYQPPEYGYDYQTVTGSLTLTIPTKPMSDIPTTSVSVQTSFVNGSAASGVSVYASVVGAWYWWNGKGEVTMWSQTGSNGIATLTVPNLPLEVNTWTWLPVDLPKNVTTIQVVIGGEEVNVTVYWQPTYVGLAGKELIIPPKTSANIMLHAQQADYWVMPYGAERATANTPTGLDTAASLSGGIPISVYNQYQASQGGAGLSPTFQSNLTPPATPPSYDMMLAVAVAATLAAAAASLVAMLVLRKKR